MNISLYLPDNLKDELDAYVKDKGINKNSAIRQAIELMLDQEKKRNWGDWINHIEPNNEFPSVENLRKDLSQPGEVIL